MEICVNSFLLKYSTPVTTLVVPKFLAPLQLRWWKFAFSSIAKNKSDSLEEYRNIVEHQATLFLRSDEIRSLDKFRTCFY